MEEDDNTLDDRSALPPFSGPPTIQEQLSPFHVPAPGPSGTIQGMPSAQIHTPQISHEPATLPGGVPLVPPQIVNAPPSSGIPSSSQALPPDGPTVPDGVPAMLGGYAPPSEGDVGLDEMPTDPYAFQKVRGVVPAPDAPKIEISKSMQYDVRNLDGLHEDPSAAPKVKAARRRVEQPTEVMLPALKQQKSRKKERSDAWLVVGLIFLVFVIFALLGAVILGVMQRMG